MLTIDGIRNHRLLWGLGAAWIVLFLAFGASLAVGVTDIPLREIWQALVAFNGSTEHWIARSIRLPRSLIAVFVGASLAVSGAIMQGLTRNPIASPTLLGVNAGAALALVVGIFAWGDIPLSLEAVLALLGAALGAIAVYGLASLGRGGLTPLNL
ncbi:MAG: iron chelate uptake ABC transporter family permease subunit, partial [Spirulinaceae cyanobacterium]